MTIVYHRSNVLIIKTGLTPIIAQRWTESHTHTNTHSLHSITWSFTLTHSHAHTRPLSPPGDIVYKNVSPGLLLQKSS